MHPNRIEAGKCFDVDQASRPNADPGDIGSET
jgi:hypothetical protein